MSKRENYDGNPERGRRPNGIEGRMEADSSRSEQSAESRGSSSEDFGSRSYGQNLDEASESCSSAEDLATDE